MSKTTKRSDDTKTRYTALLAEAKGLVREAGQHAKRRAELLCRIWADKDFQADHVEVGPGDGLRILNGLCEDLCLSFEELRQVYQRLPDDPRWEQGRLRAMYFDVLDKIAKERPSTTQATRPAAQPTPGQDRVKALETKVSSEQLRRIAAEDTVAEQVQQRTKIEQQLVDTRRALEKTRRELEQATEYITELEAENASLKEQLTGLCLH